MSKCNIENLKERFFKKNKTDDEWLELRKDMSEYIHDENNPWQTRRRLQFGFAEAVVMICDGIEQEKKLKEQSQTDKKE